MCVFCGKQEFCKCGSEFFFKKVLIYFTCPDDTSEWLSWDLNLWLASTKYLGNK